VAVSEPSLVRLPNGVRIALDPMPSLATAAVGVWVRVGARWEEARENGIAHLFEHMAFKGAGPRDARQFAEDIENVGGAMNAATGYERTSYYARVLGEHVPFALDLIADILFAPHWQADELEKEKGVVAQERGEAFDQPDDRVFEIHQAALYKGQALGRPILGEDASLANVDIAALHRFRDAHMTPDRVVISIAGAFDKDRVLEVAHTRFGGLGFGIPQAETPALAYKGGVAETRKLEQAHLVLSWPAPSAGDDKLFSARILSEIFGGGMASRLFQEVREQRGLVYAIDSFLDAIEDDGRLMVYAGCAAENAKEVSDIVAAQLHALADHGPTPQELARAKAVSSAQLLMGLETPSGRAEWRAAQIMLRDDFLRVENVRAKLERVTAEDVQALARLALAGPACAALVGPKAGHGALDAFRA
jgi:predicted Zn-dependent peptidase